MPSAAQGANICPVNIAQEQKPYRIHFASASQPEAETVIDVLSEIASNWGYGVHALAYDLHGRTGPIRVRMNSVGGDLIQGVALRNFLQAYQGQTTVEIIGLAASSATIMATGAKRVEIRDGAFYMIHQPYTYSGGTYEDLENNADTLKKMEANMAEIYVACIKQRGKQGEQSDEQLAAKVSDWMKAETWFTAKEAVEYGFADVVLSAIETEVTANIAANTSTKFFAKLKNAPQSGPNTDMAKEKSFLAKLFDLVKAEMASEKTEPPPAPEETPKEEAEEEAEEAPADVPKETPDAETETIEAKITAAVAAERKKWEAEATTKPPKARAVSAPPPTTPTTLTAHDAVLAEMAKALAPLAKSINPN